MEQATAVFAYLGPETMLPLTSVVAGAAGVVLMLGRGSLRFLRGLFGKGRSGSKARPEGARPMTIRALASDRKIGNRPVGRTALASRAEAEI